MHASVEEECCPMQEKSYRRSVAYTRDQVHELLDLFPEAYHLRVRLDQEEDLRSLFQDAMDFLARIMGGSQAVVQEFQIRRGRKRVEEEKRAAKAVRKSAGVRFEQDAARALEYVEAKALQRAGIKKSSLARASASREKVNTLSRGLLSATVSSERRSSSSSRRNNSEPLEEREMPESRIFRQRKSAYDVVGTVGSERRSPSSSWRKNLEPLEEREMPESRIFRQRKSAYDVVGTVAQQASFEIPPDVPAHTADRDIKQVEDSYYFLQGRDQQSSQAQKAPPSKTKKPKLASSLSRTPKYQGRTLRQQHPIRMDGPPAPYPQRIALSQTMSSTSSQMSTTSFDAWGRPIEAKGSNGQTAASFPNQNMLFSISSSSFEVVDQSPSEPTNLLLSPGHIIDITSTSSSSSSTSLEAEALEMVLTTTARSAQEEQRPISNEKRSTLPFRSAVTKSGPLAVNQSRPPCTSDECSQSTRGDDLKAQMMAPSGVVEEFVHPQHSNVASKKELLTRSRRMPLVDDSLSSESSTSQSTPMIRASFGNSNSSLHQYESSPAVSPSSPRASYDSPIIAVVSSSDAGSQRASLGNSNPSLTNSSSLPPLPAVGTPAKVKPSSQSPGNSHLHLYEHHSSQSGEVAPSHARAAAVSVGTSNLSLHNHHRSQSGEVLASHARLQTVPVGNSNLSLHNHHSSQPTEVESSHARLQTISLGNSNLSLQHHCSSPVPIGPSSHASESARPCGNPDRRQHNNSTNVGPTVGESVGSSALSINCHLSSPETSQSHSSNTCETDPAKSAEADPRQLKSFGNSNLSLQHHYSSPAVSESRVSSSCNEQAGKSASSGAPPKVASNDKSSPEVYSLDSATSDSLSQQMVSQSRAHQLIDPPSGFSELASIGGTKPSLSDDGLTSSATLSQELAPHSGSRRGDGRSPTSETSQKSSVSRDPPDRTETDDSSRSHESDAGSQNSIETLIESIKASARLSERNRNDGAPRSDPPVSTVSAAWPTVEVEQGVPCSENKTMKRFLDPSLKEFPTPNSNRIQLTPASIEPRRSPGMSKSVGSANALERHDLDSRGSRISRKGDPIGLKATSAAKKDRNTRMNEPHMNQGNMVGSKPEHWNEVTRSPNPGNTIEAISAYDLWTSPNQGDIVGETAENRSEGMKSSSSNPDHTTHVFSVQVPSTNPTNSKAEQVQSIPVQVIPRVQHGQEDEEGPWRGNISRTPCDSTSPRKQLRRVPSSGDDVASRKELLLTSKPTEKTYTTVGQLCSQTKEGSNEDPSVISIGTTVSSLSAPFEAKKTKQRSHPGTKQEKRRYYRSRGNHQAYRTFEPSIRRQRSGSKSVGSYSTWATNDEDLLVTLTSETAYVRESYSIQQMPIVHTLSDSSESTAIEDIIARCQRKLHFHRK